MVLIQIYFAFAFATAITAWWGFFKPSLDEARRKGVNNVMIESPILSSLIFIIITTILAPFVISALVSPLHGEYFRIGLQRVLEESDK